MCNIPVVNHYNHSKSIREKGLFLTETMKIKLEKHPDILLRMLKSMHHSGQYINQTCANERRNSLLLDSDIGWATFAVATVVEEKSRDPCKIQTYVMITFYFAYISYEIIEQIKCQTACELRSKYLQLNIFIYSFENKKTKYIYIYIIYHCEN